jgi:hypothetical protein
LGTIRRRRCIIDEAPCRLYIAADKQAAEDSAALKNFKNLFAQAGDALAFHSFEKTNGYDQNYGGTKLYILEWEARFTVTREIWKRWDMIQGSWNDFNVTTTPRNNPSFLAIESFHSRHERDA